MLGTKRGRSRRLPTPPGAPREVASFHSDHNPTVPPNPKFRFGGGSTNNEGSFNRFTTSASTFSKAPASYVSSSLTTKVSLLKSAADVVKCTDVDYATGSFCSSCSIPPPITGGLWSTGKGCAMCDYDYNDNYGG